MHGTHCTPSNLHTPALAQHSRTAARSCAQGPLSAPSSPLLHKPQLPERKPQAPEQRRTVPQAAADGQPSEPSQPAPKK